ncbi:MAG TPA: hypothetical protein VM260_20500, partial [Pirellula sp.]|nr:hypothetical protein [Pirellula sp.]
TKFLLTLGSTHSEMGHNYPTQQHLSHPYFNGFVCLGSKIGRLRPSGAWKRSEQDSFYELGKPLGHPPN